MRAKQRREIVFNKYGELTIKNLCKVCSKCFFRNFFFKIFFIVDYFSSARVNPSEERL